MKGTLEIIPIKIRDTIDKKEDIEGLRYCLQFEDLEETELPKKEELNKIRIAEFYSLFESFQTILLCSRCIHRSIVLDSCSNGS